MTLSSVFFNSLFEFYLQDHPLSAPVVEVETVILSIHAGTVTIVPALTDKENLRGTNGRDRIQCSHAYIA